MIKRAMIALAASAALVPAAAMAQTVADPDPTAGVPDIALVAAAAAQGAGQMGPMRSGPVRTGGPLRAGMPGRYNPGMRMNARPMKPGMGRGGSNSFSNSYSNSVSNSVSNSFSNSFSNSGSRGRWNGGRRGGWSGGTIGGPACGGTGCGGSHHGGGMNHGGGMHGGMHGGGNNHHFRFNRVFRGGFIPPQFFGGQFVINNWSNFGFSQPGPDSWWIRYYDDALLIDRNGRVLDGRYGFDWDRYGGGWAYGDDGAPYWGGEDSDEWDEDMDDGYARGDYGRDGDRVVRVERHVMGRDGHRGPPAGYRGPPMPMPMPPMPPAPPGYGGYGYGYGYGGYGYGGGVVIVTETTVNPAPVVETRTVYETVVERVRVAPRVRHKVRCVCSRPAPPPRPGERG